jgi:cysteine desulfurase family protein
MAQEAGAMVEDTRALLAELFGVRDSSRIVFTLNATDALNMAIKGALSDGGHVVTTTAEHNSVARPLNRLEKEGVIEVTRVAVSRDGGVDPEDIRHALRPCTKLVAVLHASNVTGTLQPITAIGKMVREHGALFLVDAAQTAGAVPIDVEESAIDLLAFPGHKSLLGLPGTGGLYAGPRARLAPWREGGTGILSELPLQPSQLPHALEAGSPNTLGLAGLNESVRFILARGVDRIRARELALTQRFIQGVLSDSRLRLYGPASISRRVSVVSVNVAGAAASSVADFLDRHHGIAVRAGLHCAPGMHGALNSLPEGTVRVSPGYFTEEGEIDACLKALAAAADEGAALGCRLSGAGVS